ncbi:amidase, partial [Tremellales sp. Uapishka_1]
MSVFVPFLIAAFLAIIFHLQFPFTSEPPLHKAHLPPNIDLLTTSVQELALLLRNDTISSVQLVKAYLQNIEQNDIKGLGLRAVIQIAPEANGKLDDRLLPPKITTEFSSVLGIAESLDKERREGKIRSELHGIPILVKDNIGTDPGLGMATTAGSYALKNSTVRGDAFVITKLREAGAIVLAKANLQEFAAWKGTWRNYSEPNPTGVPNSWSAIGGQTSSAYVEGGFKNGGDPLGSSSGSAVGLSAGFGAAALGTDSSGSVVLPAARAAVFGIRPTLGLISRGGVVPITLDSDTIGPMGFTTYDTALLLEAISGEDPADPSTLASDKPQGLPTNYTQFTHLPHAQFANFRLGVPNQQIDLPLSFAHGCVTDVRVSLYDAIVKMGNLGAEIVYEANMDLELQDINEMSHLLDLVFNSGFHDDLPVYLEGLEQSDVRSLRDLINFNDRHANLAMPADECCQELIVASAVAPPRDSPEYRDIRQQFLALAGERGLEYVFNKYNVDAIVTSAEFGMITRFTGAMAYPHGTVPLGYCANGLPYGLSFVTRRWEEDKLIALM